MAATCNACSVPNAVAGNGITFCPHCDQWLTCGPQCRPCAALKKFRGSGPSSDEKRVK